MTRKTGLIATAVLALSIIVGGSAGVAAAPAPGTISIEAKGTIDDLGAALPSFVDAVGQALAARGFTLIEEAGHAALVAELSLSRVVVGSAPVRVPVDRSSVAPGGAFGSVGAGVSLNLPTGKSRIAPLQRTRLEIRIHRRGEQSVLWQGAAITVRPAGTRTGRDEAVAADLTEALLRAYPAQPADIISVP
jgi:hypothetical protein